MTAKGHGLPSSWCHGECPSEPPLATCQPSLFNISLTVKGFRLVASHNSGTDIIGSLCTSWINVSRSRSLLSLKSTRRKFPVSFIRGGTTSIVAQWVYFIDHHDRPRSVPRSLISKITQGLLSKLKRTSIDLDRYLDRSACIDRKSDFDRYLDRFWTGETRRVPRKRSSKLFPSVFVTEW